MAFLPFEQRCFLHPIWAILTLGPDLEKPLAHASILSIVRLNVNMLRHSEVVFYWEALANLAPWSDNNIQKAFDKQKLYPIQTDTAEMLSAGRRKPM